MKPIDSNSTTCVVKMPTTKLFGWNEIECDVRQILVGYLIEHHKM